MRARPATIAAVLASLCASGCLDTANVAQTDQPPPLLAVTESLSREHFSGLVVTESPREGVLQLRFRDPERCRKPVDSLRQFSTFAAARAVQLFQPKAMPGAASVQEVHVQIARTHRFGVIVWTTSLGDYFFRADSLRSVTVPAPPACGFLSPLLKRPNG